MTTDYADNITLQLISLIFQGHFSKDEIVDKLGISSAGFYKGLYKLRDAGFKLESSKRTYSIKGFQNELNLSEYELSTIAHMLNLCWLLLPKEKTDSFRDLIRRFMVFSQEDDYKEIIDRFWWFRNSALAKEFREKLEKLKIAFTKQLNLKIILNSGRELFVEPTRVDWEREGLYFCYVNTKNPEGKEESLNINRIAKIILEDEEEYFGANNEVIFEVYGKLAKTYLLKADERVVDSTKISLVVGSGAKDWDVLFKRLLRYDTLCKVLQPKSAVDAFYAMIEQSLLNLGADPDPEPNSDDYEQKELKEPE